MNKAEKSCCATAPAARSRHRNICRAAAPGDDALRPPHAPPTREQGWVESEET